MSKREREKEREQEREREREEPHDPISLGLGIVHLLADGLPEEKDEKEKENEKVVEERVVHEKVFTIPRRIEKGVYGYPNENEVRRWMYDPDSHPRTGKEGFSGPVAEKKDGQGQVSPSHYGDHGVQPIVFMVMNFSSEAFTGFLIGNIYKYLDRAPDKDGLNDHEKAKVYMDWLVEYGKTGQITVNGEKYGLLK